MASDVKISLANRPLVLWLLTAGGFFAFFTFGFVDNIKGPALPNLLQDLNFSYSQGGTILSGRIFGLCGGYAIGRSRFPI
ncbi:MAG: hypothetical protein KDE54_17100 [Caldilineaceae bacterium]|nr:hypothetical protein [Caldilineaceae bacterium]